MDDLISRKDALDAIVGCTNCKTAEQLRAYVTKHSLDNGWIGGVLEAFDAVEDLPSVQPEKRTDKRTKTHACDSISRQATIEAINAWDKFGVDGRGRLVRWQEGLVIYVRLRDVLTAIVNLPSVQPERKKGKWIPHIEKSREYIGTVLINVEYDYWFCNTCGYRVKNGQPTYNFCPNCGADMRGEQNGQ